MPRITSSDCSIHYDVVGNGPPLVLIAGWGCTSEVWDPIIGKLASQYQCIRIDNRGTGQSSSSARFYGVATMAKDILAVLDDLGIDSAHILGNSLGGMVAQAFARNHPERTRTLTLISSSPGVPSLPSHAALAFPMLRSIGQKTAETLHLPLMHGPGKTPEFGGVSLPPFDQASRRQLIATLSWWGIIQARGIHAPSLIVHGTRDPIIPQGNARLMRRLLPNARLRLIRGATHGILSEAGDLVAAHVLAFLAANQATLPTPGRSKGRVLPAPALPLAPPKVLPSGLGGVA